MEVKFSKIFIEKYPNKDECETLENIDIDIHYDNFTKTINLSVMDNEGKKDLCLYDDIRLDAIAAHIMVLYGHNHEGQKYRLIIFQ